MNFVSGHRTQNMLQLKKSKSIRIFRILFNKYPFLVVLDVTVNDDGWLKVNPNQTGYYRVNYPPENWNNLAKTLQNDHVVIYIA